MTMPLALVLYENLLPGSQLVNRLEDMGYRVLACHDAAQLGRECRARKPLIVLADLYSEKRDICAAIAALRADPETEHIPVLAINPNDNPALRQSAMKAGAALVVADEVILHHLQNFLDQALEIG